MKTIALETSLKPFCFDLTDAGIEAKAAQIFAQWASLWENGEKVELLLWLSDGSEILEYNGDPDSRIEYARYLGGANHEPGTDTPKKGRPVEYTLHEKTRLFMKEPPEWKLKDIRRFCRIVKETFSERYRRELELGIAFDPGPEFAVSDFKYRRHPEILGKRGFIYCAGILKGDRYSYAAYPEGIPDGTPFGTFLGKQARIFMRECGFDYIWFSNGLGFGMNTWDTRGVLFDGQAFFPEKSHATKEKVFQFWETFRKECPDCRIENRGTNLTTGIDLASDGAPLREIYRDVPKVEAPPNSPWAALDGNFGLELAGMLSHIAELPPQGGYPFRYYTHDPWWLNSPWLDRYDRKPHDIYLPLSCCRLDDKGEPEGPSRINFLSVDNSYGETPDQVPRECLPFLVDALQTAPDQAGPVIWVYPFEEYHDETFRGRNLDEIFSGDWQIIDAINDGLPLNTVISTGNLVKLPKEKLAGRILIAPTLVSEAARIWLAEYAEKSGHVIFYGSLRTPEMRAMFDQEEATPLAGEMLLDGKQPVRLTPSWSFGPIDTRLKEGSRFRILHEYHQNGERRCAMIADRNLMWIRPVNSYESIERYPVPLQAPYTMTTPLFREGIAFSGWGIRFIKPDPLSPSPRMTIRVHDNAFYYAFFGSDTTVMQEFSNPDGVPLFRGREVLIKDGKGFYPVEKAADLESRISIIQQESGSVSCSRITNENIGQHFRYLIQNLKHATVTVRPDMESTHFVARDRKWPNETLYTPNTFPVEKCRDPFGIKYVIRDVTGTLCVSWGIPEEEYFPIREPES